MTGESKAKVLDNYVGKLVEAGGGGPQSTTIKQILDWSTEADLLDKKKVSGILSKLKSIDDMTGKKIADMNLDEFSKTMGTTGDMFGGNYLKEALGEAFPIVETRMRNTATQIADWNTFLDNIGYTGNRIIQGEEDIANLVKSIDDSGLDDATKTFYKSYLAGSFSKNLAATPLREAVSADLTNLGLPYFRRTYDMDALKNMNIPDDVKANLLKKQERIFPMYADVQTYNELMSNKSSQNLINDVLKVGQKDQNEAIGLIGEKLDAQYAKEAVDRINAGENFEDVVSDIIKTNKNTEILKIDTSAEGLVNQISFKQGQDVAVKGLYDTYTDMIESTKQGLLDDSFRFADNAPSDWISTGVPMLDKAGVKVDPKVWKVFEDTNSFLVGKKDWNNVFHAMDKINSLWRGMTTAMTIGGVPVNPAFFVRNFVNNKFAMVLYGGMDPAKLLAREADASKIWNYLEKGVGADEIVGNYSVKQIADMFAKEGLMQGTNVADITEAIGKGKLAGFFSKGSDLGTRIEVKDKLAVFVDQLSKNIGATDAANKVRFTLFDYAQLTDFEKQYMKPMMAFYTWSKKNFQSFFTTWAKDPKKLYVIDKMFSSLKGLSDDTGTDIQDLLPDYMKDMYTISFGNGETVGSVYGLGTNIEAIGDILGNTPKDTLNNIVSMLAPSERVPIELLTNYSFFKEAPITDDTSAYTFRNLPATMKTLLGVDETQYTTKSGETKTNYKINPYVKYFISQVRPISGISKVSNVFADEGVTGENYLEALDYLSGVKYKQYDTDYLRSQVEKERYQKVMQKLMDAGYVNQYSTYYQTK